MKASEIRMLWSYGHELWGHTFPLPTDANVAQVKEAVWRDILGDLDVELVRRAMIGMDQHFAPTPPEIRSAALAQLDRESGRRPLPDADEALGECYRLISRFGYVSEAQAIEAAGQFSSALLAVVNAMGWQEICADENPAVFRGQFRHLYETAAARITREVAVPAPALVRSAIPELAQ